MELCNDQEACNRPLNHEGVHGHVTPTMPGLIIAPHSNTGREQFRKATGLTCLQCNGSMEMAKTESGGNFYCLGCNNVYSFDAHGWTTIQTTIFPSGDPHKYDPSLKEDFIQYYQRKSQFVNEANHLFELIDDAEYQTVTTTISQNIVDWWDEDETLRNPWQFWKRWQFWKKG